MAKQQSIRDDFSGVQWRCFLIQDYSETESVFVYKVHHSVSDGLGLMMMFSSFDDKPDIKNCPNMSIREPMWKRLIIYVLVPVLVLLASINYLVVKRPEKNGIKNAKIDS